MFVVHNRIDVPADEAEGFVRHFAERMRSTLGDVAGLQRATLMKPSEAGMPYVATMEFDSRDSFLGWMRSDAFKHAHAGTAPEGGPQPDVPSTVESYTILEAVTP
jgi:heme-degrading monooxygenase HmoA